MKIEIKSTYGELIFEGDFSCVAEAVKAALGTKKSLSFANLSFANLYSANLNYADLRYAKLRSANLNYADLSFADLSYADLSFANLYSADLSSTNLYSTNLYSADLRYADLSSAKNTALAIAMTRILPPEGNLVGWKKLKCGKIAKLLIPTHAKRSHAFGRKCRASEALVLEIYKDGQPAEGEFVAHYDSAFTYSKGKTVKPTVPFDDDFTNECGSGVHFFITREEAEAYVL